MIRTQGMINDYYKPNEKRAQEAIPGEQDTPQDKERLCIKTTPALCIQENQDKEQQRRATTSHRKAIPKEQELGGCSIVIESHDNDEACCRNSRSKFRHTFTSPGECMAVWLRIQHDNTQEGGNYRKMITNQISDLVSGHSPITSTATVLEALKKTLQELLGSDRWYGTMPKGCVIAWIIVLKGNREEVIVTESEVRRRNETKRKRKKDKSRKERKRMRNYAEALHVPRPWQSLLIAKPSTNFTTKNTKIATKINANTTTSKSP
jgi:hypothetical protein